VVKNGELAYSVERSVAKRKRLATRLNHGKLRRVAEEAGLLNESGYGFQAADKRTGQSFLEILKSSASGAANVKYRLNTKHGEDRWNVSLGERVSNTFQCVHTVVLRCCIRVIATLNLDSARRGS
jgi:hypothetical protein